MKFNPGIFVLLSISLASYALWRYFQEVWFWVAVLLCGSGQSVAAQVDTSSWHTALQLMADSLSEQPAAVLLSVWDLRVAMVAADWDKGEVRLFFCSCPLFVPPLHLQHHPDARKFVLLNFQELAP